eukprot:TRINITY_DN11742_c1_g1_i2.p1 TRINITY_DN11742_c1_g1~~TRINITY_DN11742_c1_g1_i2.p1  ORF type:complete len:407 (-),score=86.16 TRINITY_DN11742_c1_g1_i2:66-1286(-)
MFTLTQLDLSSCDLSGPIPTIQDDLVFLEKLNLANNQLNGTLPETIGNLVYLSYFSIQNNQISGTLPSSIGELTNLLYCNLGNNMLSGTLSQTLSSLNIAYFFNQFEGTIPIQHEINRTFSYLSYELNGSIPSIVSSLDLEMVLPNNSFPCGLFIYDCNCSQSKCYLSCNGFVTDFIKCDSHCPSICPLPQEVNLQLDNITGFAPYYLSDNVKFVNISNSQIQIIGDVSLASLRLVASVVIVNGSLSFNSGRLELLISELIVKGTMKFEDTLITLSINSHITGTDSIQMSNTTLVVAVDDRYDSRELISFSSNSNIDLTTIQLVATNTNHPECYQLNKRDFELFVLNNCRQTPNSLSSSLVGGIVGGVLGVVVLIGSIVFIWKARQEENTWKVFRGAVRATAKTTQ